MHQKVLESITELDFEGAQWMTISPQGEDVQYERVELDPEKLVKTTVQGLAYYATCSITIILTFNIKDYTCSAMYFYIMVRSAFSDDLHVYTRSKSS